MATKYKVVFNEAQSKAQAVRAAKRLRTHCTDILLDQQETLRDLIDAKAPHDSGVLRRHIYVQVMDYKRGPVMRGGVRGLMYPVFLEFGTSKMSPHPFLRPALAEMAGHIRRRRKGKR